MVMMWSPTGKGTGDIEYPAQGGEGGGGVGWGGVGGVECTSGEKGSTP